MSKLNDEWKVQPHGELRSLAEGLLTVEGSIEMPLGHFPRRMTVLALKAGGSAIWSPVPLDEPSMGRIEALGPVQFLIADGAKLAEQFRAWAALPDLRRIIVSHGDVIESAPGKALETAAADYDARA